MEDNLETRGKVMNNQDNKDDELETQVQLLIGKHDAIPRVSWHNVDENTFAADAPEDGYRKWQMNFADELMSLIQKDRQQLLQKIRDSRSVTDSDPMGEYDQFCHFCHMTLENGPEQDCACIIIADKLSANLNGGKK